MQDNSNDNQYESVKALVRGLHGPAKNVSRPLSHSDDEKSDDGELAPIQIKDPRIRSILLAPKRHSLQPHHSHSENALRIPTLMITAPGSPTPSINNQNRRFSFGLRRHSHSHTVFSFFLLGC